MLTFNLSSMQSSMGLYQCLGFVVTTPYYDNPHPDVLMHIRFNQHR